jgi:hypothetical protein
MPISHKILSILLLYCLLIARYGYYYGEGDQVEILSYANYLMQNTLYPTDFYIQQIAHSLPNERIFVSLFLSIFGEKHMETWIFALHFLNTIALLWAFFRLEGNSARVLWFLLGWLLLFYPFDLGGNELYHGMLTGGTVAHALGAWALVYFLEKKPMYAYFLLVGATFFQPIVGAQLFVLFTLSALTCLYFHQENAYVSWQGMIIFLIFAGGWLILLFLKQQNNAISSATYMDLIEFRTAHHFFPRYFHVRNWLIVMPLLLLGGYFFSKNENNRPIFYFFLLTLLGLMVYTIGIEWYRIPVFLTTQWFKTTIWLKPLAILVIWKVGSAYIFEKMPVFERLFTNKSAFLWMILWCIALIIHPIVKNIPYQLPFTSYKNSPSVGIALAVKAKTPENAVFVQPASVTWLKYWSKRSSYIDHKAILQSASYLRDWKKRITQLYNINLAQRKAGGNMIQLADTHFFSLRETDFLNLRDLGVTHILTQKTHVLNFPLLIENELYKIYVLK